jgi:ubiquitin-protein ligase
MYGLETIFNSIVLLLDEQNVSSPYNGAASKDYAIAEGMQDMSYFKNITNKYYNKNIENHDNGLLRKLLNAPEFVKKNS